MVHRLYHIVVQRAGGAMSIIECDLNVISIGISFYNNSANRCSPDIFHYGGKGRNGAQFYACPHGYTYEDRGRDATINNISMPDTLCTPCPRGKHQPFHTQVGDCFECGVGKFSDEMAQPNCKSCPAGFFQNKSGQYSCEA